jgi:hypothetical protein
MRWAGRHLHRTAFGTVQVCSLGGLARSAVFSGIFPLDNRQGQAGFEFFLFPSRVRARPSATARRASPRSHSGRTPSGTRCKPLDGIHGGIMQESKDVIF